MRHEMPRSYRVAFGSRVGIDGYFLRHFRLSLVQLLVAVKKSRSDDELIKWFLGQPHVNEKSIADWNLSAPKIGSRGFSGYVTLHLVKWVLYPKSIGRPVGSIFEAIIQDENLSSSDGDNV